jgi:hypothetical protein
MKSRLEGKAAIVIFGAILVLIGILATPVYPPFGGAAFWLGILLLVVGIVSLYL